MDRLFLDANVLFSVAYKTQTRLIQLWKFEDVVLCSSRYALQEARANLPDKDQQLRLNKLSSVLHLFEAKGKLPGGVSLPEKDVPILLAAIEAGATHLLTGDVQHFGPYFDQEIEGIEIALPGKYLRMRASER